MPKKPLTDKQREAKNKKARERYAQRRAAGLSPKQAKSIKKTVIEQPELLKVGLDLTERMLKSLENLVDNMVTPDKPKKTRKTGASKKKGKSKPPVYGVSYRPKERRKTDDFAEFVTYYPNANASQVIKFYREETGKSISNDKAYRIVREVREAGKQYEKVRFKMYGLEDNPSKKKYLKQLGRFVYVVKYEVEVEGAPEPFDQYIHIVSDKELTPSQIVTKTIESFQKGQEFGRERYIAKRIDPNSIMILWGIDTWKNKAS